MPVLIEACVDSVASALAAERGGARRLELCDNLFDGGTTPSAGMISAVKAAVHIPVFVIVRPGQAAPSIKELADFLVAKGLAKFKCPERVETIEAFPVTRVGKLDKPALKALIAAQLKRETRAA